MFQRVLSLSLAAGVLTTVLAASADAQNVILDNFDSYADTAALQAKWVAGAGAPSVALEGSSFYRGKAMRINYDVSDGAHSDSVIFDLGAPEDLTLKTNVRFRTQPGGSNSTEHLIFELLDDEGVSLGTFTALGNTTAFGQDLVIDLIGDFPTRSSVRKIVLTIVDAGDSTGTGSLLVDEIATSSGTYATCRPCHGSFPNGNTGSFTYVSLTDGQDWGDDLHDVHRNVILSNGSGGEPDRCLTCHTGDSSTRVPVFVDSSSGSGLGSMSCMGCHGRVEDAGNDGTISNGLGAGLRQHHFNAGVVKCMGCHIDADPENYTPVGEDVEPAFFKEMNPAYPNVPTSACDGSEDFRSLEYGLDNDGDAVDGGPDSNYDMGDFDCSCGDGLVNHGEELCDDGNGRDSDGCTRRCRSSSVEIDQCQLALGEASAAYADEKLGALAKCRTAGKVAPAQCEDDEDVLTKADNAAAKAAADLSPYCADAQMDALSACSHTVDGFLNAETGAGCMRGNHDFGIDAIVDAAFGRAIDKSEKAEKKCYKALARATTSYTLTRLTRLHECRDDFNAGAALIDNQTNGVLAAPEACETEVTFVSDMNAAEVDALEILAKPKKPKCTDAVIDSLDICGNTLGEVFNTDGTGCLQAAIHTAVRSMVDAAY